MSETETFPGQYIPQEGEDVTAAPETMTTTELAKALGGGDVVAVSDTIFDDDLLLHVKSLADARQLLAEHNVELHHAEEVLGDGFQLVSGDDKAQLIGKPLLFLQWKFLASKYGPMVVVHALEITGPNDTDVRKWKIIDASGKNGIRMDLMQYSSTYDKFAGLFLRKGLRASNYQVENPNRPGEMMTATTFYLDYSV